MEGLLRYFLPIYWMIFFLLIIVWRAYVVWRRTGVNAFKQLSCSGVHGVVVFYFRWLFFIASLGSIAYVISPSAYNSVASFQWMRKEPIQLFGMVWLVGWLVWIWLAQSQMGIAWRFAPKDAQGEHFVDKGLFARSRNPIFLGFKCIFIGVFLTFPNSIILALSVAGWLLLSVQVALEEEHLLMKYGESYKNYCDKVRRWL